AVPRATSALRRVLRDAGAGDPPVRPNRRDDRGLRRCAVLPDELRRRISLARDSRSTVRIVHGIGDRLRNRAAAATARVAIEALLLCSGSRCRALVLLADARRGRLDRADAGDLPRLLRAFDLLSSRATLAAAIGGDLAAADRLGNRAADNLHVEPEALRHIRHVGAEGDAVPRRVRRADAR